MEPNLSLQAQLRRFLEGKMKILAWINNWGCLQYLIKNLLTHLIDRIKHTKFTIVTHLSHLFKDIY